MVWLCKEIGKWFNMGIRQESNGGFNVTIKELGLINVWVDSQSKSDAMLLTLPEALDGATVDFSTTNVDGTSSDNFFLPAINRHGGQMCENTVYTYSN